jgi:DNA-directed RNA polymerase specialized sigma24 family protein
MPFELTLDEDFHDLLVRVAEKRERYAFQILFEHFAPKCKSYFMQAGAAPQVAEHLAIEAMVMFWHGASEIDPSQLSASTWVFTIVRDIRSRSINRESKQCNNASAFKSAGHHTAPATISNNYAFQAFGVSRRQKAPSAGVPSANLRRNP